jgi:hypothetical protein
MRAFSWLNSIFFTARPIRFADDKTLQILHPQAGAIAVMGTAG